MRCEWSISLESDVTTKLNFIPRKRVPFSRLTLSFRHNVLMRRIRWPSPKYKSKWEYCHFHSQKWRRTSYSYHRHRCEKWRSVRLGKNIHNAKPIFYFPFVCQARTSCTHMQRNRALKENPNTRTHRRRNGKRYSVFVSPRHSDRSLSAFSLRYRAEFSTLSHTHTNRNVHNRARIRLIVVSYALVCVCFGNRLHELFRMRPDQSWSICRRDATMSPCHTV